MTSFDPHALDVVALANAQATLEGRLALHENPRLLPSLGQGTKDAYVNWRAQGKWCLALPFGHQPALLLAVNGTLPLVCQRCLDDVRVPMAFERTFFFAPDEETAARWDQELDEDVLVLDARLDLDALVVDELILALPLVARHERCPNPPPMATKTADFDAEAANVEHPFAALAQLKKANGKG